MSNVLIELKNIAAGYDDKQVLKKVNLSIKEGDFIGVIGPNGGGKTTLLKVILGLIEPMEGTVSLAGLPSGRKDIGYMPQITAFDRDFPITVRDVVLSGLMGSTPFYKRHSKEQVAHVNALLEETGLKELANKSIGDLSGGQMQRAFLCRAIVHNPKLLILDEPSTYVDKNFEGELYLMLQKLNKKMAIVLVSHDIGTISTVVKTIACVNGSWHHHQSNKLTPAVLTSYNCPIEIVTHGNIPHRVLKNHNQ